MTTQLISQLIIGGMAGAFAGTILGYLLAHCSVPLRKAETGKQKAKMTSL